MKAITAVLTDLVSEAFESCGYDRSLGAVTISDRMDLCQFQCNGALGGARLHHKAPAAIAQDVAAILRQNPLFEKVDIAGPGFINLTLSDRSLLEFVNALGADEHMGIPQPERPQTIILDYGGPNVAKPLHIGHLRSAIIGESLKRLVRACGHRAVGDIHLGDWGLQIGLVIAELAERHPDWRCFSDAFDETKDPVPSLDVDTLNEVYPFASQRSKSDEAFRALAHRATYELQNGRPGYIALWKEILRVSVADLKKSYDRLNVSFDLWYGESDSDRYVSALMERLESKGLLRESDGALVVDIATEEDREPMPPVIVRKSDNSNIYATTDLATIVQREKDFSPDAIWYIVDTRQGLHFRQVFRCARKAGLVREETALEFLGFGTMNGSDGKPYKTRDGGVMRLSDLLETATDAAYDKLRDSSYLATVSEEEKAEIAARVGMAAVKFGDLINHRAKDYVFDLEKFLSFEGKTGTYLLYTVTRINSILKRVGEEADAAEAVTDVYTETERELLLKLLLTGNAFMRALEEKAPNLICENAYQIASVFSRFYHDSRVVDEPDLDKRRSWIALIQLTRRLLLLHLEVMGIEPVENM